LRHRSWRSGARRRRRPTLGLVDRAHDAHRVPVRVLDGGLDRRPRVTKHGRSGSPRSRASSHRAHKNGDDPQEARQNDRGDRDRNLHGARALLIEKPGKRPRLRVLGACSLQAPCGLGRPQSAALHGTSAPALTLHMASLPPIRRGGECTARGSGEGGSEEHPPTGDEHPFWSEAAGIEPGLPCYCSWPGAPRICCCRMRMNLPTPKAHKVITEVKPTQKSITPSISPTRPPALLPARSAKASP